MADSVAIEDDGEAHALKSLLESDGWRVFVTMLDSTYGPDATLAQIGRAVGQQAMGDQAAVNDATQHILSAQKRIMALKSWPQERIRQLSQEQAKKRPFETFRRIGR